MFRAKLWRALAEANDASQAANDEFERAPSPQTRAALTAAFHASATCLYPLIGYAEAFAYESSLTTYDGAIGTEDEAAARDVFEAARVRLTVAVDQAIALDNGRDEKSGA